MKTRVVTPNNTPPEITEKEHWISLPVAVKQLELLEQKRAEEPLTIDEIREMLRLEEIICGFPEGSLTRETSDKDLLGDMTQDPFS